MRLRVRENKTNKYFYDEEVGHNDQDVQTNKKRLKIQKFDTI